MGNSDSRKRREQGKQRDKKQGDRYMPVEKGREKRGLREDEHEQRCVEQGGGQPRKISDECQSLTETECLTDNLCLIILPQYGLLDALVSPGVLTVEQVECIEEKPTHNARITQLIVEITKKPNTKEKEDKFLMVLDQTQHRHISNFIRSFRHRSAEHGDEWLLRFCFTEDSRLPQIRMTLIDLVDPRNGLLDEMLSANCINYRHKQKIES